ncbi:MAG: hypothetical protein QM737_00905 [Ferruginibacter sp.]
MLQNFNTVSTKLLLLLLVCTAAGCHSHSEKSSSAYDTYKYDPKVIEKLPDYDSLAVSILENLSLFKQKIDENEEFHVYCYRPASNEPDIFNKLPQGINPNIDHYFSKLGKDLIYGFDVFKDSTIKIYISSRPSATTPETIEENLSYYPIANSIRHREFPDKDTVLAKHWQYWIRFKTHDLF